MPTDRSAMPAIETCHAPDMTAQAIVSVTRVEMFRASEATSLMRVDLEGDPSLLADALLVVRGVGLPRRIPPLPTPQPEGAIRLAFAVPAAVLGGRFALQLADREITLQSSMHSRDDAVTRMQLARTQRRLAELEAQIAADEAGVQPDRPGSGSTGARDHARLADQLAEHRVLRAQLSRELTSVRERAYELERELERTQSERERLEEELAHEQSARATEQAELSETIDAARSRVTYLELRLVELQGRSRDLD
jgi:hypothetical protein